MTTVNVNTCVQTQYGHIEKHACMHAHMYTHALTCSMQNYCNQMNGPQGEWRVWLPHNASKLKIVHVMNKMIYTQTGAYDCLHKHRNVISRSATGGIDLTENA